MSVIKINLEYIKIMIIISGQINFNYNFIMNKFINYLKAGDSDDSIINKSKN